MVFFCVCEEAQDQRTIDTSTDGFHPWQMKGTYRSSMHYHHLLLKTKLPFCNERKPKE